eukprot:TRINITY_DN11124_c1_g1_i1.p1 TRINITY_DN11124_c1_g1~~TRINITY_DN11124_c1_g1_i1.p1  ORF type:complete len:410 (+),score=101.37 TRINITY_DN11124_c1_g1_i1:81-1232(+)
MWTLRWALTAAVALAVAVICGSAPDGAGGLTVLAPSVALALTGPESTTGLIVQGLAVRERTADTIGAFAAALASPESPLLGRTVLITGASRGLGKGIAAHAAAAGARLVLPLRRPSEAERVGRELETGAAELGASGFSSATVQWGAPLDLSSLDSIDAYADDLKKRRVVVDVLINNAGMVPISGGNTKDGFEFALGVNHIGTVHLTHALADRGVLPLGRPGRLPRIVMVSSEEHRHGSLNNSGFPFGAPRNLSVTEQLNPLPRYADSKLALTAYSYELRRRWNGKAEVVDMCPGPVASDIARDAPWPFNALTKAWMGLIFPSALDAALPVLWLATDPSAAQGEVHYHIAEPRRAGAGAADPELGAWVYEQTQGLLRRRGPPPL